MAQWDNLVMPSDALKLLK